MKLLVTDTTHPFKPENLIGSAELPKDWFDVLHDVASQMGKQIQKMTWRSLLKTGNGAVVAWHPDPRVVAAKWLGHHVVYLCWGLPRNSGRLIYAAKLAKLRGVLASSNTILVNDPVTQQDIARLTGRDATLIPFVVDPDFFEWRPAKPRSDALLVPGSNDRDDRLVAQIAAATHRRVVRVTQSRAVVAAHAGTRVEMKFNVSFRCVAKLYQDASCVMLPITSSNHAAGQTAGLEAIASGTPVIMSPGRIGTLAQKFPSVIIPESNRLDAWLEAIAKADHMLLHEQDLLRQSAARIRSEHAPAVVTAELIRLISNGEREHG